ncbi:MAG: hypothetical protein NUV34_01120 [Sulfuricaulis sp.]|nr:hypothetical protein [Sulfuricaulis sp.]
MTNQILALKKAWNLTRSDMHYRHDVFSAGLHAAGYEVCSGTPEGASDRVLLMWNRYGGYHEQATRFERAGGTVIVAENGYLGKDSNGNQLYAMARHGHNGSGQWYVGGPERWDALGIELKPWRTEGKHILVCGQRGIGSPTMASPPNWHETAAARLRKISSRPVKIRTHPGNNAPKIPLADDLRDAWACVIWSSGSGVQALVAGIPVIFDAPNWICEGAAIRGVGHFGDLEKMLEAEDMRPQAMQRMAWAQCSLAEIETGEPFRRLLA